jgi:hypothetical protein
MRNRTTAVSLAAVVLALAGCGSSKKAESTASNPVTTATTTATTTGAPAPPTSFNVSLVPFGGGSPSGSAQAIVNIEPAKGELCWQFSQLMNVPSPTVARLYRTFPGASGDGGYFLDQKYTPSGCIKKDPIILELMVNKPEQFFVNIHDRQFPGGAVRGPLRG